MSTRPQTDALEGAIRDYVLALLDHREGRIAGGESVVQAQSNLRDALRAVFALRTEERPTND